MRKPRAFAADDVAELPATIDSLSDPAPDAATMPLPPKRMGWLGRILWVTASALISLGLGLAADNLIRSLFETNPWLGWVGLDGARAVSAGADRAGDPRGRVAVAAAHARPPEGAVGGGARRPTI